MTMILILLINGPMVNDIDIDIDIDMNFIWWYDIIDIISMISYMIHITYDSYDMIHMIILYNNII